MQEPGSFVVVIGTSICDMIVHPEEIRLPGITGVVKDGILPGLYGYEAGQAAVGDMLAWFVEKMVSDPGSYEALEAAAARFEPGETGLVVLDWFNGNRTILADADLSGAIFGLTLQSTREEIYRALLESIAFGSRRIMDNFEEHGLELTEIVACGGIAERSPLMMQLLADTSGREVHVPDVPEIPARGAALFGGVAAGKPIADIEAAVQATRPKSVRTYKPDLDAKADLRPGVRDLPAPVRAARPLRGRAAPRHSSASVRPRGAILERAAEDRAAGDHAGALRRHAARDHRAPRRSSRRASRGSFPTWRR